MATVEESCPACGAQVFWERDRCLRCGHDIGAPNVRLAQQEREALRQRYEMALADASQPNARAKVEAFSQTVEQQSQAVINVDPNYLMGFLESSRDFYSSYALQTAAEVRAAANMENDTARLSVETKLFGSAAPHIRYAALSLNGRGLISYGSCAITLEPRLCARAASLLEENSYDFIERHRLVGRIPIPPGHRAVWQDRHWLATVKLAQGIDDDRIVADDFPRLLLHSDGDRGTDRFIEVHIYGPFDRQAIVSAVIPEPGKSCKNKRKLYMLRAIKDLLEDRGIPWIPA